MDLITKNSEIYISFFRKIEDTDRAVETFFANCKPSSSREQYLTDREVSGILKISRRTLQEYRSTGRIAYSMVGGKILYKESDIEKLLMANYSSGKEER